MKHLWWIIPLLLLAADLVAGLRLSNFEPRCYVLGNNPLSPPSHQLLPSCDMPIRMAFRVFPLRSNSLGMRDGQIREALPSPPHRRLLLLGDSFTEGIALPWEETFAGILSSRLAPGTEVLNAGLAGSLPSVYLTRVQELLREGVRFDEALVLLDTSDVFEAAKLPVDQFEYGRRTFRGRVVISYVRVREWVCHFFRYSCLVFVPFQYISWMRDAVNTGLVLSAWISDDGLYHAWGEKGLSVCAADMEQLSKILLEAKIPLTIAVYPYPQQIHERDFDSRYIRFWREWASKQGVKFIDLTPALADMGPEESIRTYYLPIDFHFSAEGHARVAKALLENMSQGTGAQ